MISVSLVHLHSNELLDSNSTFSQPHKSGHHHILLATSSFIYDNLCFSLIFSLFFSLLIIPGSCITTKHGNVNTDFILFIASGAFHSSKPSDLLAELQVLLIAPQYNIIEYKAEQYNQRNAIQYNTWSTYIRLNIHALLPLRKM